MSAAGVVRIAFARTGFVLASIISSKLLAPGENDLIEMLKNNLPHLTPQTGRAVVFKFVSDIEAVRMQPILALRISLYRVHVHWLVALIRVKMDPPALQI